MFTVSSLAGGGAERSVANMANYWAQQGCEVTVVTFADSSRDAYQLHPQVQRKILNVAEQSKGALAAIINNFRRIIAVRKVLRSVKPDIAIGMMTTAAIVVAIAGLGLRGVVRIGAERSYPPSLPLNRLWRYLRKAVFGLLDEVVVQTADGAEWIRKNTWASKVTVIPNGIPWPMPVFEPRLEPPAKEAQQRHLIAVGRLRPEKQFDQLINVFARLAERFSNWNLMIVGDGPLGPQLSQQVHMLGLQDRILIPGRVGNVSDWYQSADLAALTSEFEGFPNVLLEAMACGLPAVSYDCLTGPSDIISQGKNGLLVPVGDQAALEEALGYLMADDQARLTLSKNAVAVKERFSEPKVFSQWELLFESHVGTRGG